jgi:hypothetical protein
LGGILEMTEIRKESLNFDVSEKEKKFIIMVGDEKGAQLLSITINRIVK